MTTIKSKITKVHFYILGFVILNFICKTSLGTSLNYNIVFIIKITLYISGIVLFFWNFKPFKKVTFYFSFFALTPFIILLFSIFNGIFLGILSSIFLIPIYPNETKFENQNLKVYSKFQGFLAGCCTYEITEPKFILFEKQIGEIQIEENINPESNFQIQNDSVLYQSGNNLMKAKIN